MNEPKKEQEDFASGVRLVLAHREETKRDCSDCQRWEYKDGIPGTRGGEAGE